MRATPRGIATLLAALALRGAAGYAYAAQPAGTERTGTWIALAVAAGVALLAGLAVALLPSRHVGAAGSVRDWREDTGIQRALGAETRAKRGWSGHHEAR